MYTYNMEAATLNIDINNNNNNQIYKATECQKTSVLSNAIIIIVTYL